MEKACLKALILVGGFGTRLRPFTLSKAKPLVEFANKAILVHQIEALISVGVSEIILAINYQPDRMMDFIKASEEKYKIKISCSREMTPLNTGGPIGLAAENGLLNDCENIFVLNSDVICSYPFKQMLEFHKNHGQEGTILVTPVEDPSKYGVILSDEKNKILNFIEKPQKYVGNRINAGMYIFNRKVLNRIKAVPISLEREIFPNMASQDQLYSMDLPGFWMDIGQPKDYMIGTKLYLQHLKENHPNFLAPNSNQVVGNVLIDPTATIDPTAVIGPNVVVGPGVKIEHGSRVMNSVLFEGSFINSHSLLDGSMIGWKSKVGSWVRIKGGLTLLGEEVVIHNEVGLVGTIVLPNVGIKVSNTEENKIIMS